MLTGARVLVVGGRAAEEAAASVRSAGAVVSRAASAQVALLLLQSLGADLLLTELSLPDADGYALVHAVRRLPEPRLAHLPCVALSDSATDEERQRSLLAGFQLHVRHPVDPAALARTLGGLRRLAGRSPLNPRP